MNTIIRINARGEFDHYDERPLEALKQVIKARRPEDCVKTVTGLTIDVLRMAAKELETTDVWLTEWPCGSRFSFIRSNQKSERVIHAALTAE